MLVIYDDYIQSSYMLIIYARDILCISPYGQVCHDCPCVVLSDCGFGSSGSSKDLLGLQVNYGDFAW